MFIQKLKIYSKQLNETTQKLQDAIAKLDVATITELSAEIEKLSAKVAKYSEKAQKEVESTIAKIESGELTNYRMFENTRSEEDFNRMTTIENEVKELIIDMVVNKADNMGNILKLNEEYQVLNSANNALGFSLALDSEIKTGKTWNTIRGAVPITMIDFNKLTFKKTSKASYLYKNENERYIVK